MAKVAGKRGAGRVDRGEGPTAGRALEGEVVSPPRPGRTVALKPSRLRYCHTLASHKVAEAMPSLVDKLVQEAIEHGSMPHTTALLKLASEGRGTPEAPKRRKKNFVKRLLDELEKAPAE